MSKMKVAILNTVTDKSTGKIATGLLDYLSDKNYDVILCYGRGAKKDKAGYYRIDYPAEVYIHAAMSRLFGNQGGYSKFATRRLIRKLRRLKINTIYAISLHGYYLNEKDFFDYMIQDRIKLVYVMIDEYAYCGKCGYANGCENYLSGCGDCPQKEEYPKSLFWDQTQKIFKEKESAYHQLEHSIFVGPQYTVERALKSPLLKNANTRIIDEAIDLNLYYPRDTEAIRLELGIDRDKIVLLCIAPFSYERKGCIYFLELARRMADEEKYVFVHVGFDGDSSICPDNYIPIGYEYDQNRLAQYYSLGDLFVFPSLLDTMPNACLEALACGTPLMCFNISGMPYIADETTAIFVEAKNVGQMVNAVKGISKKNSKMIDCCRNYAKTRYDNKKYFNKLEECAQTL